MSDLLKNWSKVRLFLGKNVYRTLVVTILSGFLWFLVELSFVYVLQIFLVAIGLLSRAQTFIPSDFHLSLAASLIFLILFGFVRGVVYSLKNYLGNLTYVQFMCEQRSRIAAYALYNYGEVNSSELMSSFTDMVQQSGQIVQYSALLINSFVVVTFFILSGFYFAPIEMLLGLVFLALIVYPVKLFSRKVDVHGKGLEKEWLNINKTLMGGLKNNLFLRINNLIKDEVQKVDLSLNRYQVHYQQFSLLAGFLGAFPLVAGVGIIAAITYISLNFVGTNPIKLISFFYIFIRLSQSASEMSGNVSLLKIYYPSFKRVFRFYEKAEASLKLRHANQIKLNEKIEFITFDEVSFFYEPQKSILSGQSFLLKKGDVLLIRGESGKGKSTILSLLLGILVPTKGRVLINQHDIHLEKLDMYEQISYVGPEPYLVPGTVKENLEYGDVSINESEAYEVLQDLGLDGEFSKENQGLHLYLNEATPLSTGQKQRLSIARAFLKKGNLIIFDEGTANLDEMNEKKVIELIARRSKDSIVIIVSHKDSFERLASQKIIL